MNAETNETPSIEVEIGASVSLSIRFTLRQMVDSDKAKARIEHMRGTINNRIQYLKRRYGYEFDTNLVDAVTADRQHIVVTMIATRMK